MTLTDVNPAEERDYLEQVLIGKAQPTLSPAGTLGRLAQLHIEAPKGPESAVRALVLARAGLAMSNAGSPLYPKFRHFEAMALRALPAPPPEALGMRGAAAEADREAWRLSLKDNPADAVAFAKAWSDWAWERDLFEEAGEAYSNAQRAQTKLVLAETDAEARMKMLSYTSFATRGAWALEKTGHAHAAILLLEQTRLPALNGPRQRSELLRLQQAAPELSARLEAAAAAASAIHEHTGPDAFGGLSPEEKKAAAEIASIVAGIRRIAGFESFAQRAGWDDVAEASAQYPLVYLVPTDKGTAAIGVAPGGAAPGGATPGGVAQGKDAGRQIAAVNIPARLGDIWNAFRAFAQAEYEGGGDRRPALHALLEWLGSRVMVYVKSLLIELSPQEGPFTLIPFGPFAGLPVHAGMVQENESGMRVLFHPRNVTFAYSAGGLAAAQRKSHRENAAAGVSENARALVVSNPRPIPPEFDTLLLADFEARMVTSHFPRAGDALAGRDADTRHVLELLPAATVAHFTCHGTVDARFGYTGVLLLANTESLNYEHLRALPELAARLVALSACSTGPAALGFEQGVNLPNAFLAAGAAAVLGTLWHTDELASLLLLTRFYQLWLDPETKRTPGQALGDAQAWLMTTPAQTFRAMLQPGALASEACRALKEAADNERLYADPWFWGGFFLAGA